MGVPDELRLTTTAHIARNPQGLDQVFDVGSGEVRGLLQACATGRRSPTTGLPGDRDGRDDVASLRERWTPCDASVEGPGASRLRTAAASGDRIHHVTRRECR